MTNTTKTPNDHQLSALVALANNGGRHNLAGWHRMTKTVLVREGWATFPDGIFYITAAGHLAIPANLRHPQGPAYEGPNHPYRAPAGWAAWISGRTS